MSRESIESREKITIVQGRNVVTINCYRNSKSYVQGKSTALFEKVISTAISFLTEDQTAIEKLNEYHALTINKEEVETKFEQLLPNYKHESKKHYTNLLTAVYNTMLTGYMPDYTCLVTPIFRAYEYYLHKMLGDYMGLDTETDKGTNNFGFFTKNDEGLYECNNKNVSKLNRQQLDYLNKFYTQYNKVRHPYSHWSADDSETAVITNINEARNLLDEGIKLIDKFYTLFRLMFNGGGIVMQNIVYNEIDNENYIGIISVLDYEISVRRQLRRMTFDTLDASGRKIIVDLVLKVGFNEYRFVEYDISKEGKIILNSKGYIPPSNDIVKYANSIIRKYSSFLPNSMLSNSAQIKLFNN